MQWPDNDACNQAYQRLIEKGVLVRNISKGPGLTGCLRVSVGTQEENDVFLSAF